MVDCTDFSKIMNSPLSWALLLALRFVFKMSCMLTIILKIYLYSYSTLELPVRDQDPIVLGVVQNAH